LKGGNLVFSKGEKLGTLVKCTFLLILFRKMSEKAKENNSISCSSERMLAISARIRSAPPKKFKYG
jgi:hypothetical protein